MWRILCVSSPRKVEVRFLVVSTRNVKVKKDIEALGVIFNAKFQPSLAVFGVLKKMSVGVHRSANMVR